MKKIFYVTLPLVAAFCLWIFFKPKQIDVDSVILKKGAFDESFVYEGIVRARDRSTVYAMANGNISGVAMKTGDLVKKRQELTWLKWDENTRVLSPIDGVVSKVYRESAGPIMRGEPIVEIIDLTHLEVIVDLLTTDAVRLSVNGKAKIINWGEASPLDAEISQINRSGTVKISALGVEEERTEVKLLFKAVDPRILSKLGDTYHVDVRFLVSREENVLSVPLGALFKVDNEWAIYLMKNGRAQLQRIKVSKMNESDALVSEGLEEGREVILFPSDRVRQGTRVR